MSTKQRLGEILTKNNLATEDDIEQAMRVQVGGNRRLGHILVTMGVITADQLAETIADQMELTVCNVSKSFDPQVKKILPRYLCKQYGVIPLQLKKTNVLLLAMANPSDCEARNDIENYTGKAVETVLAKQTDIDHSINSKIPLRFTDLFPPKASLRLTQISVILCICLVLILGTTVSQYFYTNTYGTKNISATETIYKNHDLFIGIKNSGDITLLGRGLYTDGFYAVSFSNKTEFNSFHDKIEKDLSDKQKNWINWVTGQL